MKAPRAAADAGFQWMFREGAWDEKATVLVVDDDRRMVKTICDILRIKGFETEAAHTGADAVAKVRERRPDCVLMDVRMPDCDGLEALPRIKELCPDLPVVMTPGSPAG